MSISAKQVKELREKSGGMMNAKKALVETGGDIEQAMDWLRTKGLAKAAAKAGRTASEGLISVAVNGDGGVLVEINSETDFVARNTEFQEMVSDITDIALDSNVKNVDDLLNAGMGDQSVADFINDKIAKIGENIQIRRIEKVKGNVVFYVHNQVAPGLGQIGVLVAMDGRPEEDLGRQIAMHIAATNPTSLSEDDMDQGILKKERQIQKDIARESGKPEQVIEKMVEGRMRKFIAESTLLNQSFVVNPDLKVKQAIAEKNVTITAFARMELGEGIDIKKDDFASEVTNMVSSSYQEPST